MTRIRGIRRQASGESGDEARTEPGTEPADEAGTESADQAGTESADEAEGGTSATADEARVPGPDGSRVPGPDGSRVQGPDEARAFIEGAEARLAELEERSARAEWIYETYITEDTARVVSEAQQESMAALVDLTLAARDVDAREAAPDVARRLRLLRLSHPLPGPVDPERQRELTSIHTWLEGEYGRGKHRRPGGEQLDLEALSRILAERRDPAELLDAWAGWHAIGRPMRPRYRRFVELANEGARAAGARDLGMLWRSGYDMEPDAFEADLERIWQQVRPLYLSLHAFVRHRLGLVYGQTLPADGPLPAHLLGNMWGQEWSSLYPLLAPEGHEPAYDLTALLRARAYGPLEMVRAGESFFTSLGFEPLPATFWERSLFTRPADREVMCHASAWDMDGGEDLRLKMCIEITGEDFSTIHHELGHTFYQRAYRRQPYLFRGGANDGFHEAIGDAVALSVTPEYLVRIGLLDAAPGPDADIPLLLQRALDRVPVVPWALLVDRWRWEVFDGRIAPADYNRAWWDLKLRYQGIAPPILRTEDDFDPGAKYHIPANTPYARYLLASVLQFQFHRALAGIAGQRGPLHRASIHGSREAGEALRAMLELGSSRPWPDALESLTGQREVDPGAMLEYFAPLRAWLDEQNAGLPVGW